ncbi:MAG TPA: DNA repair protein RadA [Candidatus Saccharimonadales bacterium]|jgi:DNA repair protein RadA/Sms|nr:DNA repair protein RadA [Candidatus Saccharimonadales bacterium]
MAKKDSKIFVCESCGAQSSSWSGRCYSCGEWNTLQEQVTFTKSLSHGSKLLVSTITQNLNTDLPRLVSGMKEIDSIFGGGIVPGSVTLLAGQPGIGKSTLLLQISNLISKDNQVLYVSGEESSHQVSLRAKRLGVKSDNLKIANTNSTDQIVDEISSGGYKLVVVDSIQTIACDGIPTSPGSISQITNSANLLINVAKAKDCSVILVGHVTKEGNIAGPKVLEHIVDVVIQIEGDRYGGLKLVRAIKNRFGSTEETGIYDMKEDGFQVVDNPSAALLAERQVSDGSIVFATIEGNRPLLVEVQALVNKSSYGYPKRAASGIDLNRVNLLVAMLEKRTKLNLSDSDIYINIVGGIKITEPAVDLAICMAIASASRNMQMAIDAVVFGEIGLSGEIRHVPYMEKRIAEAIKLGFDGTIGPRLKSTKSPKGHRQIRDIKTALNEFLKKG